MLSYKDYINKIENLNSKKIELQQKFSEQVKNELHSELSKYLKPILLLNEYDRYIQMPDGSLNKISNNDTIYTLDNKIGIAFREPLEKVKNHALYVDIFIIFRLERKLSRKSSWKVKQQHKFDTETDSISEYVPLLIENINKILKTQQKHKENREIRKIKNNYNL
jgi:hypothetical protein